MRVFRNSPAKHVCADPDCGKKFRPFRADAEYCSNACRQSHYRLRMKARTEADAVFRIRQNTPNFESNKRTAIDLYSKVRGVEVIATNAGILVAEMVPGARALAASILPNWQETPCEPADVPKLIRAAGPYRYQETERAQREEHADRDFRYRVAERDFIAAMKGPVRSIAHFTHEPDAPIGYLPPVSELGDSRAWKWWEEDDRPKREYQPEMPVSEWLSRGMSVTDKSKLT
jgi:antitoxin (DNA-binding transcriptional repressor) of toxin-antitoxin stability system